MPDHDPWLDADALAWIGLSARLQRFVADRSRRADVVVRLAPRGPVGVLAWPSGYRHDIAEVLLDARRVLVPGSDDPDLIDPRAAEDRSRHSRLVGVACMAAAQAAHTHWNPPADTSTAETALVRSLEQLRAVSQYLRSHAADRRFVRAAVACLFGSTTRVDSAAVLGLGRCGVLTSHEVEPVRERLAAALGPASTHRAEEILRATVQLADGDRMAVEEAARSLAHELQLSHETAPARPGDLARTTSEILLAAAESAADAAPHSAPSVLTGTQARDVELSLRAIARSASTSTFAKTPSRGRLVHRRPDEALHAQARDLTAALRRARFRPSGLSTVPSRTPPGRLRLGEAMRRESQVRANAELSAAPWRQTRRRGTDQPLLRVGLSWDVSRSRTSFHGELADAAWLLATAVNRIEGRFAAVAWNNEAFPVVDPSAVPRDVIEPRCEGGSNGCAQSLRALDGALNLSDDDAVRVLVVATDGKIGRRRFVDTEIGALASSGVRVLWLTDTPDVRTPRGAMNVARPEHGRLGAGLGHALCNILSVAGA